MKRWLRLGLIGLLLPTTLLGQSNRTLTVREHGRTGRLFAKPQSSKDTLWLKVGAEFVRAVPVPAEKPARPWPGALTVKVDINPTEGYFNAQGLHSGVDNLDATKFRYTIDGGQTWQGVAWAWHLPPGTYTVRCEFTRPGYAVGFAEKTFVIPGKPTGQVPVTPNLPIEPKPGGGKVPVAPKPDEARLDGEFNTDAGEVIQPAASRLRRIPRLVLSPLTRTVDPDFGSIPAFDPPAGLVTIYQDAGDIEQAKTRGWRTFYRHGLPGAQNMVMLYNNIFGEDGDRSTWTRFRRGIGDPAELPDLIQRARNAAGGWRGPDGRMPAFIAVDWEIEIQPGQEAAFYRNRGAIIQALRAAFPESKIGHYGGMPMPVADGATDFHMVGDYTILNCWDGHRHIEACQNPDLWNRAYNAFGEWAFLKFNEGRKAQRTRSEGKGLMAFWNLFKDGCESGKMAVRDDVAEGSLLIGILGGMEGVWPWNAHCGPGQNCTRLPQVLSGTRAITAALYRLSQPGIRELLDGNQTYFAPAVSTDGKSFIEQPSEFDDGEGGFARPAYASLRASNGHEAFAAYNWPDNLPVVVGIRNKNRVALAAVFPREQNPAALRQVWVKDAGFSETFILKGRSTDLFVTD